MDVENFTKQMRKATREIHAVSDALVNAKLAFALSDNRVWAEGLLVFYEIFRFLEEAIFRLKDHHVGKFNIEGLARTKAFQDDLDFYLTKDWVQDYKPRESVVKYLLHLQKCEQLDPNLLMAYIYHLYMGLLSGGQILTKKRSFNKKILPFSSQVNGSYAVTDFGDIPISELKRTIVNTMNDIATELDEDTKQKLIEESKTVFLLNNTIIRSIEGTTIILLRKVAVAVAIASVLIGSYLYMKTK